MSKNEQQKTKNEQKMSKKNPFFGAKKSIILPKFKTNLKDKFKY
jgi:hypothetical protein